jgi:hypothetical protein
MVLGVAGAAFAGSAVYTDVTTKGTTDPATVTVNAKVNPKITLTISTDDGAGSALLLDWATTPLDPGSDPVAKKVTLVVESNKDYSLNRSDAGMAALAPFNITYSLGATNAGTKPGATHEDLVDPGVVSWNIAPDTLFTGSLVYTAIQTP